MRRFGNSDRLDNVGFLSRSTLFAALARHSLFSDQLYFRTNYIVRSELATDDLTNICKKKVFLLLFSNFHFYFNFILFVFIKMKLTLKSIALIIRMLIA